MRKGLVYREFFVPACRPVGQTTQSTATFIAGLCFFSGIAFAAFGPLSAGDRILHGWVYFASDVLAHGQAK
jgi:hypothetical protein